MIEDLLRIGRFLDGLLSVVMLGVISGVRSVVTVVAARAPFSSASEFCS